MAFTLEQLRSEIKFIAGARFEDDARTDRLINLSQERIARAHDWKGLRRSEDKLATWTGTALTDKFLAFSSLTNSNPRKIYSVVVLDGSNSRKLTRVSPIRTDAIDPSSEDQAVDKPGRYIVWNDKFEWLPIPDKAYKYRIRMTIWPATLTTGNSSSLKESDDLIISLTASVLLQAAHMDEEAARQFIIYEAALQRAIEQDLSEPDLMMVPGGSFSDGGVPTDYWADPFFKG